MLAAMTGFEVLTPDEMSATEQAAIAAGDPSFRLMQAAGAAVVSALLSRFGDATGADILCGPGNNGGDGYVVAKLLAQQGWPVRVWAVAEPGRGLDAARARAECPLPVGDAADYRPVAGSVVVDALFGGGLSRPLDGAAADLVQRVTAARLPVLAIDIASGISGATGLAGGPHITAAATVTFMRPRVGHLLYPGKAATGALFVADIGIAERFLAASNLNRNLPGLWAQALPRPGVDSHKYSRGHAAIVSGGPSATGAARLSALAAARIGAGAVTLLSPADAMAVNAAHLTAIMLRQVETMDELGDFVASRRVRSLVLGPGLEADRRTAQRLVDLVGLPGETPLALVIDASALTAAAAQPESLWAACGRTRHSLVFTPHDGEFSRLFPDIAAQPDGSKVEKARAAARRANGVVVYKGADTVIASPDGRAAINVNGSHWLATAGSGDVLAGMIGGLLAQRMPAFEAACASAWMHAEAAHRFGPGLIADDLPTLLPRILGGLFDGTGEDADGRSGSAKVVD